MNPAVWLTLPTLYPTNPCRNRGWKELVWGGRGPKAPTLEEWEKSNSTMVPPLQIAPRTEAQGWLSYRSDHLINWKEVMGKKTKKLNIARRKYFHRSGSYAESHSFSRKNSRAWLSTFYSEGKMRNVKMLCQIVPHFTLSMSCYEAFSRSKEPWTLP